MTRARFRRPVATADMRSVKRLCLLLLACAIAAPAALAEGPPGPPGRGGPHPGGLPPGGPPNPPTARTVAGALCTAELRQLGEDAFKVKYPTRDACLDAHADQAAQILETCKTADDPKACLRDAVGAPEDDNAGEPFHPASPRRPLAPLVHRVASMLCRAEFKSLGADAFKAKYTTPGACMKAMAAKAAAMVKDAQTQCASAERKRACVRAAIAKTLGLPARPARK